MPYSLHHGPHARSWVFIKKLEKVCLTLTLISFAFNAFLLYLLIRAQSLGLVLSTQLAQNSNSVMAEGWTLSADKPEDIYLLAFSLIIDMCFTCLLFLSLRGLLASIRRELEAEFIASAIRGVAIYTIFWPIVAFVAQISGDMVANLHEDIFHITSSLNLPLIEVGVAIYIGSFTVSRLRFVRT